MTKYIYEIAEILKEEYGDFAHYNKTDPLQELIFIICSLMTTEKGYLRSYRSLTASFLTPTEIHNAAVNEVRDSLQIGGLSSQKANHIKKILQVIYEGNGEVSLDFLKGLPDKEVESFLVSLPGVGLKTARCVMLYSLNRKVFPVDTHCWRISHRIGWVRNIGKSRAITNSAMNRLQAHIPKELRFSLHVNMVSHGRKYCRSVNPECSNCPISRFCRKISLKTNCD